MVIKETVEGNEGLVRFYSDAGFLIRKIGTDDCYGEAVELATTIVEYEEIDILAEVPDEEGIDEDGNVVSAEEIADMRAALKALGVVK